MQTKKYLVINRLHILSMGPGNRSVMGLYNNAVSPEKYFDRFVFDDDRFIFLQEVGYSNVVR